MSRILRFEDRWTTVRELAKRLDRQLENINEFSGDECMRKMSPIVRKLLTREEVPSETLWMIAIHVREHLREHVRNSSELIDTTWGEFYNVIIWKTFSSLLATVVPNMPERHVGECLVQIAAGIIVLDDAIARPKLYHLNTDRDLPLLKDDNFEARNELADTVEERAFELLKQMGGEEI